MLLFTTELGPSTIGVEDVINRFFLTQSNFQPAVNAKHTRDYSLAFLKTLPILIFLPSHIREVLDTFAD